ncbi:hypothetical protein PIB30_095295 [Stylosanthes scabra]|uniref:Uncharacterized protein n=1 Tax=Stylosanthes scabra TaxID=79078 RepID=A0ABU6YWC2_9FABA|nr:hypothetical protein [Stylosanthes scabra]
MAVLIIPTIMVSAARDFPDDQISSFNSKAEEISALMANLKDMGVEQLPKGCHVCCPGVPKYCAICCRPPASN